MLTCFYCGLETADLEQHAEQSEPCARKALAFIQANPDSDPNEQAAAVARAQARIEKASRA